MSGRTATARRRRPGEGVRRRPCTRPSLLHRPPFGAPVGTDGVVARIVLPPDGRALPLHVDGAAPDTPAAAVVLDRRRLRVPAGGRVSFATWFAAFPAAEWARWTDVPAVRLDVEPTGPGSVELFRSDAAGRARRVPGLLAPLDDPDGGRVWFDVVAGAGDVVLERADWVAVGPAPDRGSLTLALTTYDRPESALAVLGGRLRLVEQANLGGSGGFARGMLETLQAGRSRYVVLLDDDIVLEPESLLRALAFADACRSPTLVSAAMLDLQRPTVLHTPGERVDRDRFLWETVSPGQGDHDLAEGGLRSTLVADPGRSGPRPPHPPILTAAEGAGVPD